MNSHLQVWVHEQLVGSLSRMNGLVYFTPNPGWLAREQVPTLGLSFRRDSRPRRDPVLPSWFENLLPEQGSRLRSWLCRQADIGEHDSLALLAHIGQDLVGAVRVLGNLNSEPGQAAPSEFPRLRFSLAGMQLKLSMLLSGTRFILPAQDQSGSWIVKIPGGQFADLPQVEFATMEWARSVNINVPEFKVTSTQSIEGLEPKQLGEMAEVFAIRRFDRGLDGARIHQEDFAQALDYAPSEKYAESRGVGYDGLTKLVLDICGVQEAEEFLRRVAFVVASGNDDAHLKNWSFQWIDDRAQLSPAYDLVCSIAWPDFGWDGQAAPTLALALGRRRGFDALDGQRLKTFARRCGLEGAEEKFRAALLDAQQRWSQIAPLAPERMRQAIRTHWRRVPLLAQLGPLPE